MTAEQYKFDNKLYDWLMCLSVQNLSANLPLLNKYQPSARLIYEFDSWWSTSACCKLAHKSHCWILNYRLTATYRTFCCGWLLMICLLQIASKRFTANESYFDLLCTLSGVSTIECTNYEVRQGLLKNTFLYILYPARILWDGEKLHHRASTDCYFDLMQTLSDMVAIEWTKYD